MQLDAEIDTHTVVANRDNVLDYVIHNDIDEVFIACPDFTDYPEMREWIKEWELMGILWM